MKGKEAECEGGGEGSGKEAGSVCTSHGLLCVHHHNFDDRIYGDEVRGGS